MCLILVEKFPDEIIEKNAWAKKLQMQLQKNKKMSQQLNKIHENLTLSFNPNTSLHHSIEFRDHQSMASGVSAVS